MMWTRSVTGLAGATAAAISILAAASAGGQAFAQGEAPAAPAAAPPGGGDSALAPASIADNKLAERVAAIVNDDIISTFDLRQRIMLLVITAGVQPTQENLPQLEREALRQLVDEHLELGELRRQEKEQKFQIIANDKDVDKEIAQIARGNNMTAEQLLNQLAAAGVGPQTFRDQLRAEVSWRRWIQGRYGSRLRIGDDQVSAVLQRLNASATKPQYEMSEIFIDAARVGGMDAAMNGANQLVAQLQQGAPFPAVARQFSASPTAASGGDAGWLSAGEMPNEVQEMLDQMRPGQLSKPIAVQDGVYIVFLREKRSGQSATLVGLKQAAISLPADAPAADVEAAHAKLLALKGHIKNCADMEAEANKVPGVVAGDLGEAEIKDLAPDFRQAAETLQTNQVSDPIRTKVGLHLVAVCSKRQSGGQMPNRDQIEDRLYSQQLAMISKRYLRDLRNSATIETR